MMVDSYREIQWLTIALTTRFLVYFQRYLLSTTMKIICASALFLFIAPSGMAHLDHDCGAKDPTENDAVSEDTMEYRATIYKGVY